MRKAYFADAPFAWNRVTRLPHLPLALVVAVCKALTVLFVFMDFGGLATSAKLAAAAALLMVALLLGLMVADVATREAAPLSPPKASLRLQVDAKG